MSDANALVWSKVKAVASRGFGGMPVDSGRRLGAADVHWNPHHGAANLDYVPRGVFSDSVVHVYPKAIANGEILAAHVASGKWRELSTLKRYLDISVELLKEAGKTFVADANRQLPLATFPTRSSGTMSKWRRRAC
jgi:hypothetical protein